MNKFIRIHEIKTDNIVYKNSLSPEDDKIIQEWKKKWCKINFDTWHSRGELHLRAPDATYSSESVMQTSCSSRVWVEPNVLLTQIRLS